MRRAGDSYSRFLVLTFKNGRQSAFFIPQFNDLNEDTYDVPSGGTGQDAEVVYTKEKQLLRKSFAYNAHAKCTFAGMCTTLDKSNMTVKTEYDPRCEGEQKAMEVTNDFENYRYWKIVSATGMAEIRKSYPTSETATSEEKSRCSQLPDI